MFAGWPRSRTGNPRFGGTGPWLLTGVPGRTERLGIDRRRCGNDWVPRMRAGRGSHKRVRWWMKKMRPLRRRATGTDRVETEAHVADKIRPPSSSSSPDKQGPTHPPQTILSSFNNQERIFTRGAAERKIPAIRWQSFDDTLSPSS